MCFTNVWSFIEIPFTVIKGNSIANDQREITPKISKAELWFLFLQVIWMCFTKLKFHWNTSYGYQVIKPTGNSIANNQREITPKISKAELWFLCMTHRLNVLYKCMKFLWNISYGFQVIKQTRFCDRQTDRGKGKCNVSRPFLGGDIMN